jgi:hypothetical protein
MTHIQRRNWSKILNFFRTFFLNESHYECYIVQSITKLFIKNQDDLSIMSLPILEHPQWWVLHLLSTGINKHPRCREKMFGAYREEWLYKHPQSL